jgi:type VI secretion system secreted protein VgrG
VADVFAHGVVITAMHTHARRDEDFSLRFDGIPDSPILASVLSQAHVR